METSAEKFYSSYIKEYHEVRANYFKLLLTQIDDLNNHLQENESVKDNIRVSLTDNTKFIIQADLRQNYFHCLETFFEFFFVFLPQKKKIPDNSKIVRHLVQADWRKHPKKIKQIASDKMKLNILDQKINFIGHEVSVGHYLFFPGTFSKEKFGGKWYEIVDDNVKKLKEIIKIFAIDLCERDEYNAYKHTMRVFPNFNSMEFFDVETKEKSLKLDLSNSISFQTFNDRNKETILNTKMLDPERDYQMTKLCSRLIHNIIALRDVMFNSKEKGNGDKKVAVHLFENINIAESSKHNVDVQNITFSKKKYKRATANNGSPQITGCMMKMFILEINY